MTIRRLVTLGGAFAFGAGSLLVSSPAEARDTYPGVIQQHLQVPCVPSCLLCHTSTSGGTETLRLDRGFYVDLASVTPGAGPDYIRDEASLIMYIDSLGTAACQVPTDPNFMVAPCDYDGDGKSDYEELAAGEDPTVSGPGLSCDFGVKYGCGARVAPVPPERPLDGAAFALSLAAALALFRRTRRLSLSHRR